MKKSSVATKIFIALFILILLGVLGGGGYLAYTQFDRGPKFLDKTTTFKLDTYKSTIISIPSVLFVNNDDSSLVLTDDGKIILTIMIDDTIVDFANGLTDSLAGFDLQMGVDQYCKPLFPGFTLNDVPYSFGLLDHTLGLSFIGLDLNDPRYKTLLEEIRDTGFLPKGLSLPTPLGIKYEGKYEIKTVQSEQGPRTAIYFGKELTDDEDRYFMMEMKETNGKKALNFRVEFLQFTIVANQL